MLISFLICLLVIVTAVSCGKKPGDNVIQTPPVTSTNTPPVSTDPPDTPTGTQPPTSAPTEQPSQTPSPSPTPAAPTPEPVLVPYDGIVEHIFFHEVIAYPELAFYNSSDPKGYDDYMVTVSEYNKILESLHKKNYILVNMNDVWSEYTDGNGVKKMRRNTLMLPEGKLPLIISFDDINFYNYMIKDRCFMNKLIIGDDGEIWASGFDPGGNPVITQDLAAVPILDKFVRDNPDFSLGGAKGCLALTGYEGILGYRTHFDAKNDTPEARLLRRQEIARVKPVVEKLKENGWYFATHSYGHIKIGESSLDRVKADATRWMDEVGSLVGETKIFIYPFGSRLDGNDVYSTGPAFRFYHELGFRYFASVGYESFSYVKTDIAAIVCDRMNIDGITLRGARQRLMRFFDAKDVFDPQRSAAYGNSW